MSLGHQLVAITIDQQLKTILTSTFLKALDSLEWSTFSIKIWVETLVDLIYSYLSFDSENWSAFSLPFFSNLLNGEVDKPLSCSPGMRVVGLTWEERGSSMVYLFALLGHSILLQLRKLSLVEGWRSDSSSLTQNEENDSSSTLTILTTSRKKYLYEIIKYLLAVVKCSTILNYLFFLITGEYPTLAHRLSGFKMKRMDEKSKYKLSQLNLEYRKMLWYTMMGLVTALTISFDWQYYRNYLYFCLYSLIQQLKVYSSLFQQYQRRFRRSLLSLISTRETREDQNNATIPTSAHHSNSNSIREEEGRVGSSLEEIPLMQCSICETSPPQHPYVMDCGHYLCYLCYYNFLPSHLVPEKRKEASKNAHKNKTKKRTRQSELSERENSRNSHGERENSSSLREMDQINFFSASDRNENRRDIFDLEEDEEEEGEEESRLSYYCPVCYHRVTACIPWTSKSDFIL